MCCILSLHVLWCAAFFACTLVTLVMDGWLYVAYWQIIVHYHGIRGIVLNAYLDGSSMLQKTSACHSITVVVEEMVTGLKPRRHVKLIALLKWVSFLIVNCSLSVVPEVGWDVTPRPSWQKWRCSGVKNGQTQLFIDTYFVSIYVAVCFSLNILSHLQAGMTHIHREKPYNINKIIKMGIEISILKLWFFLQFFSI
jgi:hypothetical protein